MKGINTMLKYALMNDQRWDVQNYDFKKLVSELSENDKNILLDLDYIGDGELSGLAMNTFAISTFLKNKNKKYMADWAQVLLYTQGVIVYDEVRHGVILKELYSLVKNKKSWKSNILNKDMIKYFIGNEVWNNEYELLVSLFLGEITNVGLYKSIVKKIEHPELKQIFKNIAKDENRHKTAWFALTQDLLSRGKKHKKKYIKAFLNVHALHQAEVNETFTYGIRKTQKYLTNDITSKIDKDRYMYMKKLLGDSMPLSETEMNVAHKLHNYKLIQELV